MLQFNISQKFISYYRNVGKGNTELCYLALVVRVHYWYVVRVILITLLSSVILLFIFYCNVWLTRDYRKYGNKIFLKFLWSPRIIYESPK